MAGAEKNPARHANVAIFVPHAGCPHCCSFCDQRAISGIPSVPSPEEVGRICEKAALSLKGQNAEIAFFGGSFTAIPVDLMESLLKAAAPFVKNGTFYGIRVSTRPDAVNASILALLKSYGVTAVELGAQSMDDRVLAANGRGHTAADVERAAEDIHNAEIELGLQMMTGLYKSSDDADMDTARLLAALRPATMRVYPTLVMEHTALARLYRAGAYSPPPLDRAVMLCADLLDFFERENGIPVIRMGLHAGDGMQTGILAGPWHPAFRELCEGELYRREALIQLKAQMPQGGRATLFVNSSAVSRMVGHKRCNIASIEKAGYNVRVRGDSRIAPMAVKLIKT